MPEDKVLKKLELWGIPLLTRDWEPLLKKAKSSKSQLITTLKRLSPGQAKIVDLLHANPSTQTRSWLLVNSGISKDELDSLIEDLINYEVINLLKNRSKLDNSADVISLEPDLSESIAKHKILISKEIIIREHRPKIKSHGLEFSSDDFALASNGLLPDKGDDPPKNYHQALKLMDDGFMPVLVFEQEAPNLTIALTRKTVARIDGVAILRKVIDYTQKFKMRSYESNLPGKRELDSWADRTGVDKKEAEACFAWAVTNGWIVNQDGFLTPSELGLAWQEKTVEDQIKDLIAILKNDFSEFNQNPFIPWSELFKIKIKETKISNNSEWESFYQDLSELVNRLNFYWMTGAIVFHLNDEFLDGVELSKRNDPKRAQLIVTGDHRILIDQEEAGLWQILLLRAFCLLKTDSGLMEANLTFESFFSGLSAGFCGKHFLAMLKSDNEVDLPQNIEFLISDWIETCVRGSLSKNIVLNLEANKIDELLHDPDFTKFVVRRSGLNDVILYETDEREIYAVLEKHSVLIDSFGSLRGLRS